MSQMPIALYLLTVAYAAATRSTCRRKVGCVLADSKGRILSTGYNGSPRGVPHCSERGCSATQCDGPTGCSKCPIPGQCDTVHAEVNALLQCKEPDNVYYAVVTRAPCLPCLRALMNSSCKAILFGEFSSHSEAHQYWTTYRPDGSWERLTAQINITLSEE